MPTLGEAMANWLRARKPTESESKAVAEEASKKLPGALMPRAAIEKKRKQLEELDKAQP